MIKLYTTAQKSYDYHVFIVMAQKTHLFSSALMSKEMLAVEMTDFVCASFQICIGSIKITADNCTGLFGKQRIAEHRQTWQLFTCWYSLLSL